MKRPIVLIDEEKCTGCGLCVPECVEGAIEIVDGKARLIDEIYCDGLGACLGHCPEDAITIEEKDAAPFDEEAVQALQAEQGHTSHHAQPAHAACPSGACPSAHTATWGRSETTDETDAARTPSQLSNWPVQLTLISPNAPYFEDADLLVAADCVPFAYGAFHSDLLRGKVLVVGCPKLDDAAFYREKLTEILRSSDVRSVTVAHMEVPCCFGLGRLVEDAIAASGKTIPLEDVTITLRGERESAREASVAAHT